jgi:hypothetical protein
VEKRAYEGRPEYAATHGLQFYTLSHLDGGAEPRDRKPPGRTERGST